MDPQQTKELTSMFPVEDLTPEYEFEIGSADDPNLDDTELIT